MIGIIFIKSRMFTFKKIFQIPAVRYFHDSYHSIQKLKEWYADYIWRDIILYPSLTPTHTGA